MVCIINVFVKKCKHGGCDYPKSYPPFLPLTTTPLECFSKYKKMFSYWNPSKQKNTSNTVVNLCQIPYICPIESSGIGLYCHSEFMTDQWIK